MSARDGSWGVAIKSHERGGWECLASAAHAAMRRALQLAAQPNEPWDSLSQILVLHDAALWIYRQAVMNSGYDHPVSVWVSLEEARLLLDCWTGLPDRNVMVRAAERMVRAGLGVDPEGVVS